MMMSAPIHFIEIQAALSKQCYATGSLKHAVFFFTAPTSGFTRILFTRFWNYVDDVFFLFFFKVVGLLACFDVKRALHPI
jgi:hypothetical protein